MNLWLNTILQGGLECTWVVSGFYLKHEYQSKASELIKCKSPLIFYLFHLLLEKKTEI